MRGGGGGGGGGYISLYFWRIFFQGLDPKKNMANFPKNGLYNCIVILFFKSPT